MQRYLIGTYVAAMLVLAGCGDREAARAEDQASQASSEAARPAPVSLADLRAAGGRSLQEHLDFAQEECGARPLGFEEGGLTAADLNRDGRPDYLIDMSLVTCGGENSASAWCGSGGCSFDVFVSRGEDFHQDSFLGMEPGVVQLGDRLGVAAMGRDGRWTVAWDGEAMSRVDDAGASGAADGGTDEAAVREVVASIYDVYVAGFDSGAMIPEGVETANLRAIIDAAADPEVGGLGFDYYCACQDYGDVSYDISGVAVEGDRATAVVDFRSYGALTQIELRLRKVGGRWQVDDVIDPNGSLREQLAG